MWIWFEIFKIVCYTDLFHDQSLYVIQHVECGEEQGGMWEYVLHVFVQGDEKSTFLLFHLMGF
jgi:hypothetical protein